MPPPNQNSCVSCSRRKIKCDKLSPCSSCSRTGAACVYRAPVPSQRHRKRLTQGDLLSKIQEHEALLRSHGIPFDPLANSWINSPWEKQLTENPQIQATVPGPGPDPGVEETAVAAKAHPSIQDTEWPRPDIVPGDPSGAAQLWSELPDDLKTPPIPQLERPGKEMEEQPTQADTTTSTPSILIAAHPSTVPGQLELHPNPKHVFRLWQAFVDNVNPLTKIIHAPTLQQKIFETAWAVESATKPLEAIMLAVYALAVNSMESADCFRILGENKTVLVSRYRTGALRALSGTDLFSTRDLETLQALALVLMIDHQSEFATTAVALALRVAHKMGLHRAGEDSHMPFFQQEMRVRLWWYIRGLNSRIRRSMGLLATIDDLGDTRLPMNVNDADLHPRMVNPPAVQHTAATEMVYCLMKYDLWTFVRKSSNCSDSPNPREKAFQLMTSTSFENMAKKKNVLGEVDRMLHEKYLDHLDPSIPLHQLSAALANITIHRQRFIMFHPRHQPDGGRHMSQSEQDLVFESSVRLVELDRDVRRSHFSLNLVDHMACQTPVEAMVHMVSELRRRTSGPLVETAWSLLEEIFVGRPSMLRGDQKFYAALADLVLEAWDVRWRSLELQAKDVPKYIETLQVARGKKTAESGLPAETDGLQTGFLCDSMYDEALDWTYWDDFLRM